MYTTYTFLRSRFSKNNSVYYYYYHTTTTRARYITLVRFWETLLYCSFVTDTSCSAARALPPRGRGHTPRRAAPRDVILCTRREPTSFPSRPGPSSTSDRRHGHAAPTLATVADAARTVNPVEVCVCASVGTCVCNKNI